MKEMLKNLVMGGVIVSLLMGTSACEKEQTPTENEISANFLKVDKDGTSTVIEPNLKSAMIVTPAISDDEMTILLKMKEEEKLARDVYWVLYEQWGSRIFSNIARAEESHLNAIIFLLTYYDSPDTLVADPGVFNLPEFQASYNDLVAAGSISVEEAYKTGALIEEMDIKDLTEALEIVTNENIILVFGNLLKGSRNHLRAFVRQLTKLGLTYTPVYISEEEYEQIINSPMETGNHYRMNGYGRHGQYGGHGGQNGNGKGN